ncbi:MAG: hypothetical protein IBJ09_06295 [Bacteroidia bacterium]|nr:hypothetical protein [Bacteroidia bacterium]
MYRLQKQIIDLQYHSEENARDFQDRARSLYYSRITDAMESILKKYDAEDSLFRINRMELDLGSIYEDDFSSEWVRKFSIAFEEELQHRLHLIQTEQAQGEDSHIPVHKKKTEIFEYYLLHGALPWNTDGDRNTPESMADELMRLYTQDFIYILKKHGANEKVVRRLVYQLSEKQITRIIELVQPTEAKFIVETVEKVDVTRRRESFVKTDSVYFRQQLWELVLSYVLEDRGSYFNTREFVKSTLFGIADHFNMERSLLVVQFYHAVLQLEKGAYFSIGLRQIIYDIYQEITETGNEEEASRLPAPGANVPETGIPMDLRLAVSGYNIRLLLEQWIFQAALNDTVRQWLYKHGSDAAFRRRLSDSIQSREQFLRLVQVLDPPHAEYINGFSDQLQKTQEERQVFPVSGNVFRKDRYYVILTVLLSNRGSYFNKKSFVKQVLQQLAAQYNMPYELLLDLLVTAIPLHMQGISSLPEIVQILTGLQKEEVREQQHTTATRQPAEDMSLPLLLNALAQWARNGSPPLWLQHRLPGGQISFAVLWTAVLQKTDPESRQQIREFLSAQLHLNLVVQHLSETLYRQTLKRFLSHSVYMYIALLEELGSSLHTQYGKGMPDALSFRRKQQIFVLENLGILGTGRISPLAFAEKALHYFAAVTQTEIPVYISRSLELEFSNPSQALPVQKILHSLQKKYAQRTAATRQPGPVPGSAEGIIREFSATWGHVPYSSPVFKQELQAVLQKLLQSGHTKAVRSLLQKLFSRRTLHEFLQHAGKELREVLVFFPQEEHRHFLATMLADLRLLLQKSGLTLPQYEKRIQMALVLAWFSGKHTEKAYIQQVLQLMSNGRPAEAERQRELLQEAARELRSALRGKTGLYLSENTPADNAPEDDTRLIIPFLSEKEGRVLESFQVQNAGMVLLWPFMNMYFGRLEMLDGSRFRDEEAQQRAVHLLQYLATGNKAESEFELSLPKILCGMMPADPVAAGIELKENEIALSESLLGAVIQQWTVLKNTTVPTLRETFLRRSGILHLKEENWELHVQAQSYDVLLDQLPWGLQIVKLPWMKSTLFNKWR